jgi:hypothetical protein
VPEPGPNESSKNDTISDCVIDKNRMRLQLFLCAYLSLLVLSTAQLETSAVHILDTKLYMLADSDYLSK